MVTKTAPETLRVIQGPHLDPFTGRGEVITLRRGKDSLPYSPHWDNDTLMKPEYVDTLLKHDIAEEDKDYFNRESLWLYSDLKSYLLKQIETWGDGIDGDGITKSDLEDKAFSFIEGYRAALKRS
jgi:hypothetical protein